MSTERFKSESEFMAEVKSYIKEAARESAKESTELITAQLRLEMQVHSQEHEERTRVIFREELQREIQQYFGDLKPHEHLGHHSGYARWLTFRNGLMHDLLKSLITKVIWVIAIVFLTLSATGNQDLLTKALTLKPPEKAQTKSPAKNTKVE